MVNFAFLFENEISYYSSSTLRVRGDLIGMWFVDHNEEIKFR